MGEKVNRKESDKWFVYVFYVNFGQGGSKWVIKFFSCKNMYSHQKNKRYGIPNKSKTFFKINQKVQTQQIINKPKQINLTMINPQSRQQHTPMDSLDIHHEQFNRSRQFQSHQPKEQHVYKNFYRQQLDQVMHQKNQYKSLEKMKQEEERRLYNERLRMGHEAERIKQLSYKNYYQMIMNNQENIKSKYVSPFQQRDDLKEKLIQKGVQIGKVRSQIDYQRQLRRQQNVKRQFQTVLHHQMNQKEEHSKKEYEQKHKTNQYLKNVLLTPHEVQRLQRERRLNEMTKYKEDLDKLKTDKYNMSQSQLQNPQTPSKSNSKLDRHNALLNPVPFNIQNPYILKEMQRKNMLFSNPSYQTIPEPSPYTQTRKNNIFG